MGDDIEAGETTAAEDTTFLIGKQKDDADFVGDFVMIVGPDPGAPPAHSVHGVMGVGTRGAAGVFGVGSPPTHFRDHVEPAGVGVIAVGGRVGEDDTPMHHGAGVVAVAGGSGAFVPQYDETGGVGVYGQGGDAHPKVVVVDGKRTVTGPPEGGPGIIARGGHAGSDDETGPGVIALSGDVRARMISTPGAGVCAAGNIGLRTWGRDKGAVFEANDHAAQVQLLPHEIHALPEATPVSATAVDMSNHVSELPRDGEQGDLLALSDR
jgi:hypothetical protein